MRRRRVRVQPSKPAMILSLVMGILFVLIGIFVVIPNFGLFGIFWTLIAACIAFSNAAFFFGKGGGGRQIIIEDEIEDLSCDSPRISDAEQRLTELQNLYNKGLITRDEYDAKRAEIIEKL